MAANAGAPIMSLDILERPAVTVIGMNIRTRPMSPEIPALWPCFVRRIAEIESISEPDVSYGVMRHKEGGMDVLHYMAAVAVEGHSPLPAGMESLTIPAGTYARFRYSLSGLARGFGEIFGRLLPTSDFVQDSGPYFERYDESFRPGDPESMVEIHLPVRRRNGKRTP
jgi:AraC family transcriptional regulator